MLRYLCSDAFLTFTGKEPFIVKGINLPFKLAGAPVGSDALFYIKIPDRFFFHTQQQTIVCPCQLWTQCVYNWIGKIKSTHF